MHVQMAKPRSTMTMSEARASFAKVLTRAEQGEAVQVTRAGRPVAVILSVERYREVRRDVEPPSVAFRAFMKALDRRVSRGKDPWAKVRDRSIGRDFSW